MTEHEARVHAVRNRQVIRVTCKDGEFFIGTCDFRMDRVNIEINDGKVVKASIG